MNYHDIQHDTMLQGSGLRVALFVSGCDKEPKCKGCHNAIAWNKDSGIPFDNNAKQEIFEQLDKDYIAGVTFLGGEPLASYNISEITVLAINIKCFYPNKNIWCYTGKNWEEVKHLLIMNYIDVLCEGEFIEELADVNYPYVGSTNQRLIDVQKSLKTGEVILYGKK